jgi:hypothetical protein
MTNHLIYITKTDGKKELFEEDKLVESLKHAGGSDLVIGRIVERVENEMKEGMSTTDIYRHAFGLLREESIPAATRYSLRRALAELGPAGFPFERFIAEIFKSWGYETKTDQIVQGNCVQHEIDVVAKKPDKLVMVEAKFHNEFGLKSDIKVALYVKARFDDLRSVQKLDEGWLITNTKFTEQAIKYAECVGLKMIGWNYPVHGNLHDLVTEAKLHPLTCLSSLSLVQKRSLLSQGIILCKEINPELLHTVGLDQAGIDRVHVEAKMICG